MITAQDKIFSKIEDIMFSYYQRRFSNKKTFDTILVTEKLLESGIITIGNISTFDGKYFCVKDSDWDDVINIFWAKRMAYATDTWDCDKYAIAFKAMCNELGINSSAIVIGDKTPKAEGDPGHCFNIFLNDNLDIFVFEPQSGKKVKVEKGNPAIIDGSTYTSAKILI